jgi:hypothetical protein
MFVAVAVIIDEKKLIIRSFAWIAAELALLTMTAPQYNFLPIYHIYGQWIGLKPPATL